MGEDAARGSSRAQMACTFKKNRKLARGRRLRGVEREALGVLGRLAKRGQGAGAS